MWSRTFYMNQTLCEEEKFTITGCFLNFANIYSLQYIPTIQCILSYQARVSFRGSWNIVIHVVPYTYTSPLEELGKVIDYYEMPVIVLKQTKLRKLIKSYYYTCITRINDLINKNQKLTDYNHTLRCMSLWTQTNENEMIKS